MTDHLMYATVGAPRPCCVIGALTLTVSGFYFSRTNIGHLTGNATHRLRLITDNLNGETDAFDDIRKVPMQHFSICRDICIATMILSDIWPIQGYLWPVV